MPVSRSRALGASAGPRSALKAAAHAVPAKQPVELLEPRRLLAGAPVVVINEFVAINDNGLADSFGERSDWIELHNPGTDPVNLLGWRLTDDPNDPSPWVFPAKTIPAGGYLVVFANERNTTDPNGELGTDFNLDGPNGEYLGLIRPDGSVAHQYAPRFPTQLPNVSYGLPPGSVTTVSQPLIDEIASAKVLVPANDALGTSWTQPGFTDSSWLAGTAPVGFDANGTGENFVPVIETDLQSQMLNQRPGAYLRLPFQVQDPSRLTSLTLRMRYDDGFVAYLNGQVVAQRNAPGSPNANSTATGPHADAQAIVFENINISQHLGRLVAGNNVLAIHALNASAADPDFLLGPSLVADVRSDPEPQYFNTPTPGAANSSSGQAAVADTKFSVDRGFFDAPFQVAITTATPGATIRYTTDGSAPTATSGNVYTGPVTVSTTTTIRSAAYKPGLISTSVDAQTYIFLDQVIRQSNSTVPPNVGWGHRGPDYEMDPTIVNDPRWSSTIKNDLKSIPSLNLAMPWGDWFGQGGIYISGSGIERPAAVEWINPDGKPGFETTSAVEIQGGSSVDRWKNDKLSLRLTFKQPFGPTKLNYDVFGGSPFNEGAVKSFDTLILDAILNHGWTHPDSSQDNTAKFVQEQFVDGLQNAMSGPGAAPHETWVHLYLNGVYWGIYHVHERADDTYASDYFGGNKEDYDVIKHFPGDVVSGTNASYDDLLARVRQDMSNPANYQAVAAKLDLQDFADYMILQFWVGNHDWAQHNWYATFNRVDPNGRWRFHSWDSEHVLESVGFDLTTQNIQGSPTEIHTRLRANPEYRLLFADRVHKFMFNNGLLTPQKAADAYQLAMNNIDRAIVGESARWGDNRIDSTGRHYTRDDWLSFQQTNLLAPGTGYFARRTSAVLTQFRSTNVYPSVSAPVYSQHGGTVPVGYSLTMSQANGGTANIWYTLDGSDPRLPGGAISPTAIRYTGPVTIGRSTPVKARVLTSTSVWSALNDAVFATNASALRITEVNYNPHAAGAPFTDSDDFEFVEVRNISQGSLNLKDVHFTDGIEFTFPDVNLAAGESGVIVRNVAAFQWRYGTAPRILGSYGGQVSNNLSNGGEPLSLADAAGTPIMSLTYDDDPATWYTSTDGQGRTLTVVDPNVAPGAAWSTPGQWRPSRTLGGTPGADEPATGGAAVSAASFDYAAMPHVLRFTFDRDTASLTSDEVTVRNLATGATATPSSFAYDANSRTAALTFDGGIPNGDWRATIPAAATAAPGGAGPLPQDFVLTFFSLTGDLNRDRTVNGSDFAILAANFGKTGMSYPQGDLNADGVVNGTDFAMLAGNFGRSLPATPPVALVAETAAVASTSPAVVAPTPVKRATSLPPRRSLPKRPAPATKPPRRNINSR
jgi:hypothetical protein